jgi:hypothetical protein
MHTFMKLPMQRPSTNAIGSKAQYPSKYALNF